MKVLVATTESQGTRESDFCFVPEGEIVLFGGECDSPLDSIDGRCGCRRTMSGTLSLKATTTFKVVDLPGGRAELEKAVRECYKRGRWDAFMTPADIDTMVRADVRELTRIAASFDIGDVLEKRGSKIQTRLVSSENGKKLWRLR